MANYLANVVGYAFEIFGWEARLAEARAYARAAGIDVPDKWRLEENAFQHAFSAAVLSYEKGYLTSVTGGTVLELYNSYEDFSSSRPHGWLDTYKDLWNDYFGAAFSDYVRSTSPGRITRRLSRMGCAKLSFEAI
jgi:hypothetical protein